MRYTGWRQLSGDIGDRPDLFDFGKKLLAQLDNQRRLSGVKTCAIERTMPDGSIVRARFDYEIPSIEVIAAKGVGGESKLDLIDGFIVRPSPGTDQYANTDKNHVLLQNKGSDRWLARFYDAAAVPVGYTLPRAVYGVAPPRRDLFPDGLVDYGNLDWRNAGESVMVTFHGPESRYFGTLADYRGFVFYKAQVLLSLADYPALVPTSATVRGACLRQVSGVGVCLLVAAYWADPGTSDQTDYLLRFRVEPTLTAKQAAPPGAHWAQFASLQVVDGELLHTRTTDFDEFGGHPWCFNQSGTEAVCLRYLDNDESLVELSLSVADGFTAVVTPLPTGTHTEDVTYTAIPTPYTVYAGPTQSRRFDWDGTGYTIYSGMELDGGGDTTTFSNVDTGAGKDTIVALTAVGAWTPEQAWMRCAVDYRDDVLVYAESRIRARSSNRTLARTIQNSWSTTATYGPDSDEGGGVWSMTDTTTNTFDNATEIHYGFSDATEKAAIRTDWVTQEATVAATDQQSLVETGSESSTAILQDTQVGVLDGTGTYPADPYIYRHSDDSTSRTQVNTASGTVSHAVEASQTKTTSTFYIWHLDLRYKLLATLERTLTLTRAMDTSKTFEIATYDDWVYFGWDLTSVSTTYVEDPLLNNLDVAYRDDTAGHSEFRVNGVLVAEGDTNTTRDIADSSGGDTFSSNQNIPARQRGSWSCFWNGDPFGGGMTNVLYVTETTPPGSTASYDVTTSSSVDLDAFYDGTIPDDIGLAFVTSWATAGRTQDYFQATSLARSGGFAAYKNHYCFSMALPHYGDPAFLFGLGKLDGTPSEHTIPDLTGATAEEVRFHPVSVLTPTAAPR